LGIDNPDALRILKVKPGYLKGLQKKYVKKVDSVSSSTYPFVVMYGKLRASGLSIPKSSGGTISSTVSILDEYEVFD